MKIEQKRWTKANGWEPSPPGELGGIAQIVLVFGGVSVLKKRTLMDDIKEAYPKALIAGCSTAGEIFGTQVSDGSLVATAVCFKSTKVRGAHVNLDEAGSSYKAGEKLAASLLKENLVHVLLFSNGLNVNGSELVKGLVSNLPKVVTATGGLSGDGSNFKETLVLNQTIPEEKCVTAVGFYGKNLKVGYASKGGWDPFGTERLITKSKGNVLYELDGQSALDLYKLYLGKHADGLPATGLLFPLSIRTAGGGPGVVRTILAIDEKEKIMTFAGDVPEGFYARLMKANHERLIDGAVDAARITMEPLDNIAPTLAILISCVGRKMVLGQRVEEEIEGISEVFKDKASIAGFYSYGEISPFRPGKKCALHNQTMAITTFIEK